MTLRGCGSKVSTVSARSMTWRCPTWTPSKVPIATCRGRRSTSGSEVTLMLMARGSLSRGRFNPLQGLGHRQQRPGPFDREGPDRGAPQALAVGVAEVRDQAAHVGAGRAFDLELRPV